jgi:hypothetical protein
MFNLWPFNNTKNIIDSVSRCDWISNTGYTIDGKFYTPAELMNEFIKIKDENKNLEDVLKSIQEDGTVEHNNAIKLRQENVELKGELETIELEFSLVLEINDDLNKRIIGLNHLKTENVELMERVNEIDSDMNKEYQAQIFTLKNECALLRSKNNTLQEFIDTKIKVDWKSARIDILERDLQKCAEQRDEYKHQLNAANKEIEVLKSRLRDYQDKYAESFSYNDMKKLQGKLDAANNEIKKLQDDIVEYVFEKDDELKKAQDWNKLNEVKTEKYYVCNHCGYKIAHDTNYWGGCGFCKEGLMIEKEEVVQKHPMYPIHWGGLDPDIHRQAKEQSIEEIVDALKGIKTQGFEDYDLRDFVESEIKNEDPLEGKQVKATWCYKCQYIAEQCKCNKEIEFNSEELLKRVTEYADTLNDLPKSFPNEFQEETTAENLEEKFDRGEDVMDYFKPYHCPCNMCKHAREENTEKSWEEAASDLALRVIKLEKKVEELTIDK